MRAGPLACGVNTPKARTSNEPGLPGYAPRGGYLVDEYPACPSHWLRSKGSTASYFVAVEEETGLWLDFNKTLLFTPQHVALVVSIQGINAVTGLPCEDAQLEQYVEKCPKHKTEFGPKRFCKACNFQWPKQNYVCTTGTPSGSFWIDGFRAVDGIVRQYVFTKNKERGVANAILGDQRVFAIGISCFLSKTARPAPAPSVLRGFGSKLNYCGDEPASYAGLSKTYKKSLELGDVVMDKGLDSDGPTAIYSCAVADMTGLASGSKGLMKSHSPTAHLSADNASYSAKVTGRLTSRVNVLSSFPVVNQVTVQQVEVAAGTKIDQMIHDDPHPLDFWNDKPESIMVVNYALVVDAQKILEGGRIDLSGSSDGFLQNIPVGNAAASAS